MSVVNFEAMTQLNIQTKKLRGVLRRPVFVSKEDVQQKR